MSIWWIVTCLAVVVPIHCFAELHRSSVAAVVNVLLHIVALVLMLLFGTELRLVLLFLAASVASDLVFRRIALMLRARERDTERAGDANVTEEKRA